MEMKKLTLKELNNLKKYIKNNYANTSYTDIKGIYISNNNIWFNKYYNEVNIEYGICSYETDYKQVLELARLEIEKFNNVIKNQ